MLPVSAAEAGAAVGLCGACPGALLLSSCKGCGTCVAACPAGAISGTGFSDAQVLAQIEGLLRVGADGSAPVRPRYPVITYVAAAA